MAVEWQDGKRHEADYQDVARWGKHNGFKCGLCGCAFVTGSGYRWIYCNSDARSTGNFFVCDTCDGPDVKAKRLALFDEFKRLDALF